MLTIISVRCRRKQEGTDFLFYGHQIYGKQEGTRINVDIFLYYFGF